MVYGPEHEPTLPCAIAMPRTSFTVDPSGDESIELVLAELHSGLPSGTEVEIHVGVQNTDGSRIRAVAPEMLDAITGAGFEVRAVGTTTVRVERAEMLPDTVGRSTRVLVVGLNPGRHSTARACAFGGPGNRLWPAAVAAGVTRHPFEPVAAARHDGFALTNLVRRTTAGADELRPAEYREGRDRLERLVDRARPAVVCFVGLAGFRAAYDRGARSGWAAAGVGRHPTYVMPSTSARNARTSLAELTAHFAAVARALPGPFGVS